MKKRSKVHKQRVLLQIIYLPVRWSTENLSLSTIQDDFAREEYEAALRKKPHNVYMRRTDSLLVLSKTSLVQHLRAFLARNQKTT